MQVTSVGFPYESDTKFLDRPPFVGEHRWIIIGIWHVEPKTPHSILDAENLSAMVGPACMFCLQYYLPEVDQAECPGDPEEGGPDGA